MSTPSLERTYPLPHGYRVTFCCDAGKTFDARWSPAVPKIRKPRQRNSFLEAYRESGASFSKRSRPPSAAVCSLLIPINI